MEISIGQKIDIEVDNEDLMGGYQKTVIVTWYQKGFPIYVELSMNKSLFSALKKHASESKSHNSIISIYRMGRTKYVVEPAIIIVNREANRNITRQD